jgi:integrase
MAEGRLRDHFSTFTEACFSGTAQTLLRHANLQTTAIYVQVADPKRVEAIDRLNPGIGRGCDPAARGGAGWRP